MKEKKILIKYTKENPNFTSELKEKLKKIKNKKDFIVFLWQNILFIKNEIDFFIKNHDYLLENSSISKLKNILEESNIALKYKEYNVSTFLSKKIDQLKFNKKEYDFIVKLLKELEENLKFFFNNKKIDAINIKTNIIEKTNNYKKRIENIFNFTFENKNTLFSTKEKINKKYIIEYNYKKYADYLKEQIKKIKTQKDLFNLINYILKFIFVILENLKKDKDNLKKEKVEYTIGYLLFISDVLDDISKSKNYIKIWNFKREPTKTISTITKIPFKNQEDLNKIYEIIGNISELSLDIMTDFDMGQDLNYDYWNEWMNKLKKEEEKFEILEEKFKK